MSTKTLGPFTGRQLTTIIVAIILAVAVPTAAYGFTVGHTAITDATSHATAAVTPTGSLQVAEAAPSTFVQSATVAIGSYSLVAAPPAGSALVVTTVHLDVVQDPTPGTGLVVLVVETAPLCVGAFVGSYEQIVHPGAIGEIDIPLPPGLGIPAGDALCADVAGGVTAEASISGYTVPSASVPALATHAVPAPPTQR